jgi:hypothetical protein
MFDDVSVDGKLCKGFRKLAPVISFVEMPYIVLLVLLWFLFGYWFYVEVLSPIFSLLVFEILNKFTVARAELVQ